MLSSRHLTRTVSSGCLRRRLKAAEYHKESTVAVGDSGDIFAETLSESWSVPRRRQRAGRHDAAESLARLVSPHLGGSPWPLEQKVAGCMPMQPPGGEADDNYAADNLMKSLRAKGDRLSARFNEWVILAR